MTVRLVKDGIPDLQSTRTPILISTFSWRSAFSRLLWSF